MAYIELLTGSWEMVRQNEPYDTGASGTYSLGYNTETGKAFIRVSCSYAKYGNEVPGYFGYGDDIQYISPGGSNSVSTNYAEGAYFSFYPSTISYGMYLLNVDNGTRMPALPKPEVSISCGTPKPGSSCTVNVTISDAEGRSGTYAIKRAHKAPGTNSYTVTTISTGEHTHYKSVTYTDTIPAGWSGYSVYYIVDEQSASGLGASASTAPQTVPTNNAPTVPASLTVPSSIAGGATITISWGASTDSDGNLAGYILERQLNGGSWTLVYKGAALTTDDTVEFGTNTVSYRVKAYDTLNAESAYRTQQTPVSVTNNHAPTTPASPITVSPAALTVGASVVIGWGASSDADGDAFSYVLERAVDQSTTVWTEVYSGTNRSYTDTAGSWTAVQYRVKAVDSKGAASGYLTSAVKAVSANAAPTITCTHADGADLESKSAVFSITYSVGDTDTNDALTVKEYVDGVEKKSFTATRGTDYTFQFRTGSDAATSYWDTILDGTHTIKITVSDGKTTIQRSFTFVKSVTGCYITMSSPRAASTGMHYGVAAISIYGSIPDGGLTTVEVTANASATTPTWERCIIASTDTGYAEYGKKEASSDNLNVKNGQVYHFLHKFTTEGSSFKYRIQTTKVSEVGGWIGAVSYALTEVASGGSVSFDADAGFPA